MSNDSNRSSPLRIFCVEDNPLIVMHIEQLIEEAGHALVGSADSFSQLRSGLDTDTVDGALVDIELADGCTGPEAAAWLKERGIPSIFLTGQEALAAQFGEVVLEVIFKPISAELLIEKIELFRGPLSV